MKDVTTLVIFDSNRLRATKNGGVAYGTFQFSSDFDSFYSFINEHGLTDYVDIAIPDLVIEELLQQKIEQFTDDIKSINQIRDRLQDLPKVDLTKMALPDPKFDCKEHLRPKVEEFLHKNNFKVLAINDDESLRVLTELRGRAVERRPPFRSSKNSKDVGFKDALIWESILEHNYQMYDYIHFCTSDSDFVADLKNEFENIVGKKLEITPSTALIQTELEIRYSEIINNKEWIDFVSKDYFQDHLMDEISRLNEIDIDGMLQKIESVHIVTPLERVIYPSEDDPENNYTRLISVLEGNARTERGQTSIQIIATTYLDESKGIQYTDFNSEYV